MRLLFARYALLAACFVTFLVFGWLVTGMSPSACVSFWATFGPKLVDGKEPDIVRVAGCTWHLGYAIMVAFIAICLPYWERNEIAYRALMVLAELHARETRLRRRRRDVTLP